MTEDAVRRQAHEPCQECGAPMDPQQRYCVNCAARRGNGANPASRYFAAMSKRARRPLVGAPPKSSPTSRAAAVGFFALLPIAVALGVMVGRSGSSSNDALLQALHERQTTAAAPTVAAAAGTTKKAKAGKSKAKGEGKVIAHTKNGAVHSVADFHPSKQKEAEDTHIVEKAPAQTGASYVKAQQGLPDVIVVGGSPGKAPAPKGSEP